MPVADVSLTIVSCRWMSLSGQAHHKLCPVSFHRLILHQFYVRIGFARGIDTEILHHVVDTHVSPVDVVLFLRPAVLLQRPGIVPLAL